MATMMFPMTTVVGAVFVCETYEEAVTGREEFVSGDDGRKYTVSDISEVEHSDGTSRFTFQVVRSVNSFVNLAEVPAVGLSSEEVH